MLLCFYESSPNLEITRPFNDKTDVFNSINFVLENKDAIRENIEPHIFVPYVFSIQRLIWWNLENVEIEWSIYFFL